MYSDQRGVVVDVFGRWDVTGRGDPQADFGSCTRVLTNNHGLIRSDSILIVILGEV